MFYKIRLWFVVKTLQATIEIESFMKNTRAYLEKRRDFLSPEIQSEEEIKNAIAELKKEAASAQVGYDTLMFTKANLRISNLMTWDFYRCPTSIFDLFKKLDILEVSIELANLEDPCQKQILNAAKEHHIIWQEYLVVEEFKNLIPLPFHIHEAFIDRWKRIEPSLVHLWERAH